MVTIDPISKSGKLNVLLIYNVKRSFIDRDIKILDKYFDLKTIVYKEDKKNIWRFVKESDIIISWFAGLHTLKAFFLGSCYNKKNIVIVGGYDASDLKKYGIFSSLPRRLFAKYIYENLSSLILPVDDSLKDVIVHYLPLCEGKVKVIPTGYDSNYFKPGGSKVDDVLTVCYVDRTNIWRKGLGVLYESAEQLSDVGFTIAGRIDYDDPYVVDFVGSKPDNVFFTGWVSDDELLKYYQKNKVFLLLSKYEGLPNVLCEAMLCNCVSVGSNVCGIPNAIGDSGFIVDDLSNVNETIKAALDSDNGNSPRNRIIKLFPICKREKSLVEVVRGF